MSDPLPTCIASSQVASPATYLPSTIVVVLGVNDTITWTNKVSLPHTVTSDDGTSFDSGAMAGSGTFSFTFAKPGTYTYHCDIHPYMKATVVVQ